MRRRHCWSSSPRWSSAGARCCCGCVVPSGSGGVLTRLQDTTAEIRVRCAVLLLVGLVALAAHLGLEIILGAFLAGALVGLIDRDTSSHPRFRTRSRRSATAS